MNYVHTRKRWNRVETKVNDIFTYSIATEIMDDLDEIKPINVNWWMSTKEWLA